MATLGLIGARGYTGREFLGLVAQHGQLDLALVTSGKDAGRRVADDVPDLARRARLTSDLRYEAPDAEQIAARKLDAYVLALPNGTSEPYVEAITRVRPDAVIVDLSADHRFVDTWVYGQPERRRAEIRGARQIANPGCYATAMQLALAPLAHLLEGTPSVFGVSGYSGAGTTPSPRNDPDKLRDNLMPYALVGHVHEREVTHQLGRPIYFMPHVAPFFRGITATVSMTLAEPAKADELAARYRTAYEGEPLVELLEEAPLVRDIMERHGVAIGGLTMSSDGRHAVVVATIDNLLGGAATQALRNLNLALGFPELLGIVDAKSAPHEKD